MTTPDENEEAYQITPKGWLLVALLNYKHTKPEFDKLWDDLAEFVSQRAKSNGMDEGIPCLVLEGGGHCITAQKH